MHVRLSALRACAWSYALMVSAACLGALVTLGAQSLPLRRYHHTVWPLGEATLSSISVIERSPDGYLWGRSLTGLVRFDGVRFTTFDAVRERALRVPGQRVRGSTPLLVDRAGRMWIARPDGALLTYADGVFRVMFDPDIGHVRYTRVYEDGAGAIWIGADSARGHWIRRLRGNGLVPGSWPAGVPDTGVTRIRPDTADGMWVGTQTQGLWHVTPHGSRRFALPATPGPSDPGAMLYPELQSSDGSLWVVLSGSRGGLMRIRGGVWTQVQLDDDPGDLYVSTVAQAPDGTVYLASRTHGLLVWRDGHVERRVPGDGPAGMTVHDVVTGSDGTIWATTDLGLERFRRAAFMTLSRRDGVPFDAPYEMAGDASGTLWVLDRSKHVYRLREMSVRGVPDSVSGLQIPIPAGSRFRLLTASRRGVWLGLENGGLAMADRFGSHLLKGGTGLSSKQFAAGVEDASGAVWLRAAPRGIGVWQRGHYVPVQLPGVGDTVQGWFSSDDSLRRVIVTDDHVPLVYALVPSLLHKRLDSITPLRRPLEAVAVEGRDTVWGVVLPQGVEAAPTLVRVTGGRATEVPLSAPAPGLTGFNVLLTVSHGGLWFASGDGVGRLPLAALHAAADRLGAAPVPRMFGPADGLVSPHLAAYGVARMSRASDGRLWLATPAGLSVTDPAILPLNAEPPMPHVEEVIVDSRELAADDLVRIAPNPERIDIHYTAASLRMPERTRVQYRLDGVDRSWVEGGLPRVATYTQLRPGSYRFRVRAWNEDGVPSIGEAALTFRVLPSWYQTGWAVGLAVIVSGAIGAAGMGGVARTRRRRDDAEIRGRLAERIRVARELHDTLLSGMAGIAMRLDAAATRASGTAGLDPSVLVDLRALAYHTLDEARKAVTVMRSTADALVPFWAQFAEAARRVFADTDVDVHVTHSGTPQSFAPDVEAEALRIATEALVNARKHSACRTLTAAWYYDRRGLHVLVRDDGRGFDPNTQVDTGHWGVQGMRERAAGIGAALTVRSALGHGTDIALDIAARKQR